MLCQVDGDLTSRNKCNIFYIQGASVRAVSTIGSGAIPSFNSLQTFSRACLTII